MKGQQAGFNSVVAVGMAALFILAAKTASDYWNDWVKGAEADASGLTLTLVSHV